jgi:hypothetical protein
MFAIENTSSKKVLTRRYINYKKEIIEEFFDNDNNFGQNWEKGLFNYEGYFTLASVSHSRQVLTSISDTTLAMTGIFTKYIAKIFHYSLLTETFFLIHDRYF